MIVDSSAIVAVLKDEPEGDSILIALSDCPSAIEMSAASYLETGIVTDKVGKKLLSQQFDELLDLYSIEIAPVTESQAKLARAAYRQFGKDSGHGAKLNFGDCFAYALAKERDDTLLFIGDDFSQTDVLVAK